MQKIKNGTLELEALRILDIIDSATSMKDILSKVGEDDFNDDSKILSKALYRQNEWRMNFSTFNEPLNERERKLFKAKFLYIFYGQKFSIRWRAGEPMP